ncbi:MAG: hypothetical protein JSR46_00715, partial [Verrucomicrobia bacterium]|nr:hypothetical protein [Verrucomicrobiota bacterium]
MKCSDARFLPDCQPDQPFTLIMDEDIAPETIGIFLDKIADLQRSITTIAKEQTTIAIRLHHLVFEKKEITTKHTQWTQELQSLALRVTTCDRILRQELEKLPAFRSNRIIAMGWTDLFRIQQSLYRLNKKNKDLQLFANSPVYRSALEVYKDVVAQCESLKAKDPADLLDKLRDLLTSISGPILEQQQEASNLNALLKEKISHLHDNALMFLYYITTTCKEIEWQYYDLSPKAKLLSDIVELQKSIYDDSDPTIQTRWIGRDDEIPDKISTRIEQYKKMPLEEARCFRENREWFVSTRYPNTYKLIEQLQGHAKVLQAIESELEEMLS